jgi:N-acetylmuramoyl-L-alanine amidase
MAEYARRSFGQCPFGPGFNSRRLHSPLAVAAGSAMSGPCGLRARNRALPVCPTGLSSPRIRTSPRGDERLMSNCSLWGRSPLIRAAAVTTLVTLLTTPAAARPPAAVEAVRVEGSGREAILRVRTSRPCRVVRTRLENPERLVLDFTPASWNGGEPRRARKSPVRSVRVAQHPGPRVRLVVDTGSRPARWEGGFAGAEWVGHGRLQRRARTARREPSAEPDPRVARGSLRGMVIGLDPGHGGSDPGAISKCGLMEKKITLLIAKRVRRLLRSDGVRVVMTRVDDRRLREGSRIAFVSSGRMDLVLSLHCDALEGSSNCTGITTYYHAGSRRGARLAEALQRRLPRITGLPNRGARPDTSLYDNGLYVLRNATVPAVLVETGYLSCAVTAGRLREPGFRLQIAKGIVQGLQQYVATRPLRTARR